MIPAACGQVFPLAALLSAAFCRYLPSINANIQEKYAFRQVLFF
jgi:hypothetical protein